MMRILVVDDEIDILTALKGLIEATTGARVSIAANGKEALQSMDEAMADGLCHVVTDQSMPEMTGLELLREIKQRWPDVPATMFTAYSDARLEDAVRELGFGFIEKGTSLEELLDLFRRITSP